MIEIRKGAVTLAKGQGSTLQEAERVYNKTLKPGQARRHVALSEKIADGLYAVQFGFPVQGSTSLDNTVIVDVTKEDCVIISEEATKSTDRIKRYYTRQEISEATGFENGEYFENADEVRAYFRVEVLSGLFGDAEWDIPQEVLDDMAVDVIDNWWHILVPYCFYAAGYEPDNEHFSEKVGCTGKIEAEQIARRFEASWGREVKFHVCLSEEA